MQRYNGFTMIHKALRAMLYDSALTLQQTQFADDKEAETALSKIEDVLFLFEGHAHHEDHFILPLIAAYEPSLVDEFESEHVTDLKLSNDLKNLINIFRNANFSEEKIAAGSALTKSFVEFMVFNLNHMAKEEVLINQALWKHYGDEQLIAGNRKLVASVKPEEMAIASKWMLRGVNYTDAIGWLSGIKAGAPSFVFDSFMQLASKEMKPEIFARVAAAFVEAKVA